MQKAKILTSLMLAISALVPLAGHAQDRDRDHRWDRDRHDERVDMDRRADRMEYHRWNRGERQRHLARSWRTGSRRAPPASSTPAFRG